MNQSTHHWHLYSIVVSPTDCGLCGGIAEACITIRDPCGFDTVSFCKGCAKKASPQAKTSYDALIRADKALAEGDYLPKPKGWLLDVLKPNVSRLSFEILENIDQKKAPSAAQEWAKYRAWKFLLTKFWPGCSSWEKWLGHFVGVKCLCDKPAGLRFTPKGRFLKCTDERLGCGMTVLQRSWSKKTTG